MKTAVLLLLLATLARAQSPNVVFCTGDDQVALQNAIEAQAAAITRTGGGGPVVVAAASVPCQFATLKLPTMRNGWLVLMLDNPMIGNSIEAGNNTAIKCNSGTSFLGLSGSFLWGPTCSIQQRGGTSRPLLDVAGVSQFYVEGISFQTINAEEPEVHIHDKNGPGSAWIEFRRCVIGSRDQGPSLRVDSSRPNLSAGFGLKIEDSSIQGPINITNFGQVSITHTYMHNITMTNAGIPSNGDLEIDDVLSEGLNNTDFLTVNQASGQVTDITLRRVALADTVGSSYLIRNSSPQNFRASVLIEQIPLGNVGAGMIDPSSSSHSLDVTCIGSGCPSAGSTLAKVWQSLYTYSGFTADRGLTIFGSQYVSSPLQVCAPPSKTASTLSCAPVAATK